MQSAHSGQGGTEQGCSTGSKKKDAAPSARCTSMLAFACVCVRTWGTGSCEAGNGRTGGCWRNGMVYMVWHT